MCVSGIMYHMTYYPFHTTMLFIKYISGYKHMSPTCCTYMTNANICRNNNNIYIYTYIYIYIYTHR